MKYGGWIDEQGFQQLPELTREILTIWQWYAYYDYEGVSVEQAITKEVIRILEFTLKLQEFVEDLERLKTITDKFNQENPFDKNNLENCLHLRNQFTSSNEYKMIDDKIEQMEDLVMKKTYDYLCENSTTIDKQVKNTMSKKL